MANEVRFGIKVDSNAKTAGEEGASALEQLRSKVEQSQSSIKNYNDSLRSLKGTSDEIVTAKKALQGKIDAERTAISNSTQAILKAGASYTQLAAGHKKMTEELKTSAAKSAKEEADKIKEQQDRIKKATEDAAEKVKKDEDALSSAFTGGTTAIVAGAAAAIVAIVALGAKLFEFILTSGNVLRSQQIAREAFVGSAEDAEHLGNQIEALGKKVPQSRAELNEMANDLALAGIKGQTLVDTLNAVAQTSAALGQSAGDKIKSFVDRSRLSQRFSINPQELQGTGLQFADVAKALATNTKSSVQEASNALIQGQVSLASGAEALKTAVESKFGKINLAKMLDLDVLKTKFLDTFQALTKDVDLEPLLKSFQDLMKVFDTSTETGTDLKELITWFGNGVSGIFASSTPGVKGFIETLVGGALDLQIDYLKLKIQFEETFGKDVLSDVDAFTIGVTLAEAPVKALSVAFAGVSEAMTAIRAGARVLETITTDATNLKETIQGLDWKAVGTSIVDGLTGDLVNLPKKFFDAGKSAIASIRGAFDAHSPSEEMADLGKDAVDGVAKGWKRNSPAIDEAARASVSSVKSSSNAGSTGSGGGISGGVNVSISLTYASGGGKHEDTTDFESKVRAVVIDGIEQVLRQRGLQ